MSRVDNTLGNILIKHNDKWRGDYYLTEDLTFTVNKSQAGRFYLLKSGDTTILNGDRISIHSGSKTIVINNFSVSKSNNGITEDNPVEIQLIDRDLSHNIVNSFIITNGTDNTDPITYETGIFLISDKIQKKALKYEWGMDLIGTPDDSIILGASNYKPHDHPTLINGDYGSSCESYIGNFQFLLERADGPITNLDINKNIMATTAKSNSKTISDLFERYKSIVMVILLMVVLILCVLASR